ncbi:hemerythrin domain-containing protein [Spirillospora sp. NPDC047279]|uniref:hemerythrin domain-containing protein n=1 Tax=Spirillospora sp. NPDC047279 TaxID=3155478 RepID=UPI0033EBB0D9
MTGQHDATVVDLLLRQHDEIRGLFATVEKSSGEARKQAFDHLRYLLAVHETAEEEIVHPFARRTIGNGERIIDARLKEEHEGKELLQQLEKEEDLDSAEFEATFGKLHTSVERHAEQEERLEFPEIADKATPQQLKGMVAAVKAAEAVAPTRPHPGSESVTKNVVLGPLASVVDRTRDAIRAAMR